MSGEYKSALVRSLADFKDLLAKREYIDAELMKLRQFISATIKMLPPEERPAFKSQFDLLTRNLQGLTEAVRDALKLAALSGGPRRGYATATEIRDSLLDAGFDFTGYKSNPLASISTVLARLKPEEVEAKKIKGVMTYRWKGPFAEADVRLAEMIGS